MRIKFPLFILAALMLTVPLWAQDGSKDAIVGSDHDFAQAAGANAGTLCGICHVPHQLNGDSRTLLWNHYVDGTATYSTYSSATLQATVSALTQDPASGQQNTAAFYSLACLGCHDGVGAVNVVYRAPAGTTSTPGTGFYTITFNGGVTQIDATNTPDTYIGTDLSNDHPVNFQYSSTLASTDGGLFTPVGPSSGVGYVRTWTGPGAVTVPVLFDGTVQCATCHNPHNNTTVPFLRMGTSGNTGATNLCLACHATT